MKLLTKEIKDRLPRLYSGEEIPLEDRIVICKFFTPWTNWTWYVIEGEEQDGDWLLWGFVQGFEGEFGYFSLSELEHIKGPCMLKIERDICFENVKASDIKDIREKLC